MRVGDDAHFVDQHSHIRLVTQWAGRALSQVSDINDHHPKNLAAVSDITDTPCHPLHQIIKQAPMIQFKLLMNLPSSHWFPILCQPPSNSFCLKPTKMVKITMLWQLVPWHTRWFKVFLSAQFAYTELGCYLLCRRAFRQVYARSDTWKHHFKVFNEEQKWRLGLGRHSSTRLDPHDESVWGGWGRSFWRAHKYQESESGICSRLCQFDSRKGGGESDVMEQVISWEREEI